MAYVTEQELATFMQQTLDTATATAVIEGACGVVEGYCGQAFTVTAGEVKTLATYAGGYRFRIPVGPLTAVTSVVDAETAQPVDFVWHSGSLVGLDEPTDYVIVTYDYGWTTPPAAVKAVTLAVAARAYVNPAGLRTENVDDYQVNYWGDGSAFAIFKHEKAALRRYRAKFNTVEVN